MGRVEGREGGAHGLNACDTRQHPRSPGPAPGLSFLAYHHRMTAEELIAEARANRPPEPGPSLANVDRVLRRILAALLQGSDLEPRADRGRMWLCQTLAAILVEVEDLQQRRH